MIRTLLKARETINKTLDWGGGRDDFVASLQNTHLQVQESGDNTMSDGILPLYHDIGRLLRKLGSFGALFVSCGSPLLARRWTRCAQCIEELLWYKITISTHIPGIMGSRSDRAEESVFDRDL